MPELAEVKIMGDFINHIVDNEGFFERAEKSEVSKVKTDLDFFDGGVFTMRAKTRGKEMLIHLEMVGGDINGAVTKNLAVIMGMSGSWVYIRKNSEHFEKVMKHAHLKFVTTRGNYLVLHDVRRFAKWKWADDWNSGRGPCPLSEYTQFIENVKLHRKTHRAFNLPICELLMNQRFFNGIGNYLRAEILWRLNINPFTIANEIVLEDWNELLLLCHLCVRDAYTLGGGQLKDWQNPNGTDGKSFNEWMKCYGSKSSLTDGTGRKFWYDPKWQECVPIKYTQ